MHPGRTSSAPALASDEFGVVRAILAATVAQWVVSIVSRYALWSGFKVLPLSDISGRTVLLLSRHDVMIATLAALLTYVVHRIAPGRGSRVAVGLLFAFATLHCIALVINAFAVSWLGSPLTLQWIAFADLFRSFTPAAALETVTGNGELLLLALVAAIPWAALWAARRLFPDRSALRSLHRIAAACLILAAASSSTLLIRKPGGALLNNWENPLVAFSASMFNDVPALRRPDVSEIEADPLMPAPAIEPLGGRQPAPDIVLIVLESVGAKAIEENRDSLPNLSGLIDEGIRFPNAYAGTASSVRSLFSILTGRYVAPNLDVEINALRNQPLPSMAKLLRRQGYDVAFFGGGDFRYRNAADFVRRQGIGKFFDMNSIHCSGEGSGAGISDSCQFDAAARWALAARRPYQLTIWAYEAHFPYRVSERAEPGSERAYRDALVATDRALGQFLAALRSHNRLGDTVFVIVGDHGEAFGEHGQRMHSTTVFEEEVRVPMIVAGQRLAVRGESHRLARMVDVPATILDLAGGAPDSRFDGLSLFGPAAPRRTFFFSDTRGVQVGFREGEAKYVLDYGAGRYSRYQLSDDPQERSPVPLSEAERDHVERIVAAWVQRQGTRYSIR